MSNRTVHVSLLRAVNLAGHNQVNMADLRRMFTGLGFENVQSLPQSGILVFDTDVDEAAELERLLEDVAAAQLGLETDFFVRTGREWSALVAADPFPVQAERDPAHLVVMVLKDTPAGAHVATLEDAISGMEQIRVKGRELYLVHPDGIGRSSLTSALIERKLETRGTARNWNTVLKLKTMAG